MLLFTQYRIQRIKWCTTNLCRLLFLLLLCYDATSVDALSWLKVQDATCKRGKHLLGYIHEPITSSGRSGAYTSLNFKSRHSFGRLRLQAISESQPLVTVYPSDVNNSDTHYSGIFNIHFQAHSRYDKDDSEDAEKDGGDVWAVSDSKSLEPDEAADNEDFYEDVVAYLADTKRQKKLTWKHPMPGTLPQMAALAALHHMMPQSKVADCLSVEDGSNVDHIVDETYHGYYSKRNWNCFHRFKRGFGYTRDGTKFVPKKFEPPKLRLPEPLPMFEGDKQLPSLPLGWRTFAVIGIYPDVNSSDAARTWGAKKLEDANPPDRLASGMFRYGDRFEFMRHRDTVDSQGNLLFCEHSVPGKELYRGERGDMSMMNIHEPKQHGFINLDTLKYRFSPDDKTWPRRYFEHALGEVALSQALWAKLSTTLLTSTSKMLKMYRLRIRHGYKNEPFTRQPHNFDDEKEIHKQDPVEVSVGVAYLFGAPTLHHALEFVQSDPLARCNFYQKLLLYEASDGLSDLVFKGRDPNDESPRQYFVLGQYAKDDGIAGVIEKLKDRQDRFVMRSNCVYSYAKLHGPRRDDFTDLKLPIQQMLPITKEQKDDVLSRDSRFLNACSRTIGDSSPPIADFFVINQFDYDDACEWVNRCPLTRAGCYDSLFVTLAHEVGFYGRNCKYIAPLPMPNEIMPTKQEYVVIDGNPLDTLLKRMKQATPHQISLPRRGAQINRTPNDFYSDKQPPKKTHETWKDRLYISLKQTVSNECTAAAMSGAMANKLAKRQPLVKVIPVRFSKDPMVLNVETKNKVLNAPAGTMRLGRFNVAAEFQMLKPIKISESRLAELLNQDAPVQLDRPFYAQMLRDYIYISLPSGQYFENLPEYTNKPWSGGKACPHTPDMGADEVNLEPKRTPIALNGFWMKKRDCYLLYKGATSNYVPYLLFAKGSPEAAKATTDKHIKRALIKKEMLLDVINRGAGLQWPEIYLPYTNRSGRFSCHLDPQTKLRTMYTVYPLNKQNAVPPKPSQFPAARADLNMVQYDEQDPRTLLSLRPMELYQLQLEFLQDLDYGRVAIEDNPIEVMFENGDYRSLYVNNDTVSTWEEPNVNLLKKERILDIEPPQEKPSRSAIRRGLQFVSTADEHAARYPLDDEDGGESSRSVTKPRN